MVTNAGNARAPPKIAPRSAETPLSRRIRRCGERALLRAGRRAPDRATVPGTTATTLRSARSVPSHRFQALFHSLFRVLFIFPSRYFFAIGLSPVFSLRWNLPPNLGCILKQPDSSTACRGATGLGVDGAFTLSDVPFQGTWARSAAGIASLDYNSGNGVPGFSCWAVPASLAATEGILVSFFSSA